MEDFSILIKALIVFVLLIGATIFVINIADSASCSSAWASFPNQYGFFRGCQIEVGGKWIPASSYYFKQE